jgi:hypothetical protein
MRHGHVERPRLRPAAYILHIANNVFWLPDTRFDTLLAVI